MYTVGGEGLSGMMDDIGTYLIVTYNYETSVTAAEHVNHQKYLHGTIIFILGFSGVNIIMITQKLQHSVAASTVLEIIAPHTLI